MAAQSVTLVSLKEMIDRKLRMDSDKLPDDLLVFRDHCIVELLTRYYNEDLKTLDNAIPTLLEFIKMYGGTKNFRGSYATLLLVTSTSDNRTENDIFTDEEIAYGTIFRYFWNTSML